ncbi:mechanosensitive ion channel [Sulfurimonas aquatica]|uniref:Mechanosensitive ion channel n=1 Tax=Sulfurimonas aquatica TaxID=2672570 RepID=A0A975AZM5_9BACT|nr:mechanosensitive ion channel family protein [Sulfurimonas aquatica]QSZ41415.1 mechanosensitive ion channel [Sulfurimonas aquatica]
MYDELLDKLIALNLNFDFFGLNSAKLIYIVLLIAVIYFFRKIVYVTLERNILKISSIKDYSTQILGSVRTPIEYIIIIININMIVYVYDDFHTINSIATIFNIIYGFFLTLLFYKVLNAVALIKLKTLSDNSNIKSDVVNVALKIVNFIILIIGLLVVLYFAGVDLTAVLSGLGIGGLAVAFAAKDTISNFFGTLSILMSDVFSQGDWIEIDGREGVVVEIGLRVTTLRTFDNALIAIPNGTFASKDVKNWNKRILGRRIKMKLSIRYDSKSEDIKNAVNEIRIMLEKHPKIAGKETKYKYQRLNQHVAKLVSKDDLEGVKSTLLVYLDEFSDSSINILVYCFTKSVLWDEWLATKEDVMHKIMHIIEKNSLAFAFPSLSLYNESTKTQE